jgi:hypothetical protein
LGVIAIGKIFMMDYNTLSQIKKRSAVIEGIKLNLAI